MEYPNQPDYLEAMLECASLILECRRRANAGLWGPIVGEMDQVVELRGLWLEALVYDARAIDQIG